MYVTLSPAEAAMQGSTGTIAYIEIEALSEGKPEMGFDRQTISVLTPEGEELRDLVLIQMFFGVVSGKFGRRGDSGFTLLELVITL